VSKQPIDSDEPSAQERRQHFREGAALPIVLSADERTLAAGTVINLSKRGVFLITEVGDVKMGDIVNVQLQLGQDDEEGPQVIEAQARVVRVQELSGLALFLSKDLQVGEGEAPPTAQED